MCPRHTDCTSLHLGLKQAFDIYGICHSRGWFTWCCSQNDLSVSCIDRFLISTACKKHVLDIVQLSLPRSVSDHVPIMSGSGGLQQGVELSDLRICNYWLIVIPQLSFQITPLLTFIENDNYIYTKIFARYFILHKRHPSHLGHFLDILFLKGSLVKKLN